MDSTKRGGTGPARSRSGTPEILKGYQRKPGLVVPTFSPDGTTQSCQLRPDKPRKDKKGKPLKSRNRKGRADTRPNQRSKPLQKGS